MIFHVNRLSYRADVTPDERQRGLELLRQQGESIPALKSFVVGPELAALVAAVPSFEVPDGPASADAAPVGTESGK